MMTAFSFFIFCLMSFIPLLLLSFVINIFNEAVKIFYSDFSLYFFVFSPYELLKGFPYTFISQNQLQT